MNKFTRPAPHDKEDIESSEDDSRLSKRPRTSSTLAQTPLATTSSDQQSTGIRRGANASRDPRGRFKPIKRATELDSIINHDLRASKMNSMIEDCIEVQGKASHVCTEQEEHEEAAKRLMDETSRRVPSQKTDIDKLAGEIDKGITRVQNAASLLSLQDEGTYHEIMGFVGTQLGELFSRPSTAEDQEETGSPNMQLQEAQGLRDRIAKLEEINSEFQSRGACIANLEKQLQEKENQMVAATSAHGLLTTELDRVNCEKAVLRRDLNAQERRCHDITENLDSMTKERNELHKNVEKMGITADDLSKRSKQLEAENGELRSRSSAMLEEHSKMSAQYKELKDREIALQSIRDNTDRHNKDLASRIRSLESAAEEQKITCGERQNENRALKERINKLESLNRQCEGQLTALGRIHDKLKTHDESITTELKDAKTTLANLEQRSITLTQQNQQCEAHMVVLGADYEYLQDENVKLKQNQVDLETHASANKRDLDSLKEQRDEAENRVVAIHEERDRWRSRFADLDREHGSMEREINEIQARYDGLHTERNALAKRLESVCLERDADKENLDQEKGKSDELRTERDALAEQLQLVCLERDAEKEKLDHMQGTYNRLLSDRDALAKQLDSVCLKMDTERRNLDQVQGEYNLLQADRNRVMEELESVRAQQDNKASCLQHLEKSNSALDADLAAYTGISNVRVGDWERHGIFPRQELMVRYAESEFVDSQTLQIHGEEARPATSAAAVEQRAFQLLYMSERNLPNAEGLLDLWCGLEHLRMVDDDKAAVILTITLQVLIRVIELQTSRSIICWLGMILYHRILHRGCSEHEAIILSQQVQDKIVPGSRSSQLWSTLSAGPCNTIVDVLECRISDEQEEDLLKFDCEDTDEDVSVFVEHLPASSDFLVVTRRTGPPSLAVWKIQQTRVFLYKLRFWISFTRCDGRVAAVWRVGVESGIRVKNWFGDRNRFEPMPQELATCLASWYNQ